MALSQLFVHRAPALMLDSLTFVMLSHSTTCPTLARPDHQRALSNSDTPTLPLSDSLRQPSTTSTAFGSPFTLPAFRQPSAAPGNPASLSTPLAAYAAFSSLRHSPQTFSFTFNFTSQCSTHESVGSSQHSSRFSLILSLCYRELTSGPHFLQTLQTLSPSS